MPGTELLGRYSFLFFFIVSQIFAQKFPNQKVDSLLNLGIHNILLENYGRAKKIFKNLDKDFPDLPFGKIYLAATHIAESVDYENIPNKNYIDSILTLAENQTELLLESDEDNLWNNYFEATIYGYRAYFNSLTSNLISAFADGILSLHSFQKCLNIDNNFNEALIANGIYKYWKSAQTKSLNWLPFVKDEREEAIKMLENSIKQKSYNQYLGISSLIWIYIDNNESQKAIELSNKMLDQYKNSRYFMWALARAYQDISKEKSIEIFEQILLAVEKLKNRNFYNDIVLKHKIAMLYFDLGNYNKSYQLCLQILDFDLKSEEIKNRLDERLDRVYELKNEIEEILEKNK